MLEIDSSIRYAKLDDPKDCYAANKIQNRLKIIYGGDGNVLSDKSKIIRGQFYDMRMMEGENIVQYQIRVKEFFNGILGEMGKSKMKQ